MHFCREILGTRQPRLAVGNGVSEGSSDGGSEISPALTDPIDPFPGIEYSSTGHILVAGRHRPSSGKLWRWRVVGVGQIVAAGRHVSGD